MIYQLIIREKAEKHLNDIYNWYEQQKNGLGYEFSLSVEASLFAIKRNPLHFQLRFKKVRCAVVARFPYGIYYIVEGEQITVLSVFHFKRNPKHIKNS
jgi:plasmid stabilization system protein ParE